MSVVRPRVSLTDLERAPEDGRRYELYDGEAFVVVPSDRLGADSNDAGRPAATYVLTRKTEHPRKIG